MYFKFYAGTYDKKVDNGIYELTLNTENGEITNAKQVAKLFNSSYMALDMENKIIYSITKKNNIGGVAAFKLAPEDSSNKAELISEKLDSSESSCHIFFSKERRMLFTANYQNGEVKAYRTGENGEIGESIFEINHDNLGFGTSHPHFAGITPDNEYFFIVDLGIDRLILYKFTEDGISHEPQQILKFKSGCGPRHLVFHPDNRTAYILTEYSMEIITLKYSKNLYFETIEYTGALTEGFETEGDGGAIRITKDGGFLFSSSRKPGSLSVFKINENTKTPVLKSTISSMGDHVRDFNISPDEKVLIAANRFSDNLVTFFIDKNEGILRATGYIFQLVQVSNIAFK